MTPLTLAKSADSIAYMRYVVGYGQLRGESSPLEDLAELTVQDRATVLAWYWPLRAYDKRFEPFAQFKDAVRGAEGAKGAQLRLRALASERLGHAIRAVCLAATRTPEEVVGAMCWTASCSGTQLAGVLDAIEGLRFEQILAICRTVGLRYVDPQDEVASSWTSHAAEMRRQFDDWVSLPIKFALRLVPNAAYDQVVDNHAGAGLSEPLRVSLDAARIAFKDRSRLADPTRLGAVLADLLAEPGSEAHATTLGYLTDSLIAAAVEDRTMLSRGLQQAADHFDLIPPELEFLNQGYGWLLMDRATLGPRIDEALSELDSIADLRTRLRRSYNPSGPRNTGLCRPGDSFSAPVLGSRYRSLYEALAAAEDPLLILEVDPQRLRIQTRHGPIDLPRSAVRDKAWWSGSGQSTTGRPQVRAWWAAGYGTPELKMNDNGLVTSASFPSLPGRSDWIAEHDTDRRLAQGRYTIPSEPATPYHAVFSYEGPSVWHMSDEQVAGLTDALAAPHQSTKAERGKDSFVEGDAVQTVFSDEQQIDMLVTYLCEHGETGRKAIEALLAPAESSLSEHLDFPKWLPNLLAKARRQGRIANIGTRKQPRWVATGTSAHLAAQLASTLGQDEHGYQIKRINPPALSPGQPIPADLYRHAIRHTFPQLQPEPNNGDAPATYVRNGETYLTEEAMSATLAGRNLTDQGVRALLKTIRLAHEASWDAVAAEAAPNSSEMYSDEDEILGVHDASVFEAPPPDLLGPHPLNEPRS